MTNAFDSTDALLDQAWAKLEGNDPVATLDLLADFTEDPKNAGDCEHLFGELILLQVLARLALGDVKGARVAHDIAEGTIKAQPGPLQAELANDADLVRAEAELLLAEWRAEEACECFLRLLDGADPEECGAYHQRLALCNDMLGEYETADAHMESARGHVLAHLEEQLFDEIVEAAKANLPDEFQAALRKVPVVIEPMPTRNLAKSGGNLGETPPDLLGLFLGAPVSAIGESSSDSMEASMGAELTCIRIFTRNIERACSNEREIAAEVQVTLYHELGHALGMDEAGVEGSGLA